jgi:hypothetical protein
MAAVSQVWSLASPNSMFKIRMDADFEQRKRVQRKYFLRSKKIGAESAVPAGWPAGMRPNASGLLKKNLQK